MILNISLDEFLSIYTYGGICDGQSMCNYIELAHKIDILDPQHTICYIDWETELRPVLYSIQGWITESKRRNNIEEITKNQELNRPRRIAELSAEQSKQQSSRANALEELLKMGIKI